MSSPSASTQTQASATLSPAGAATTVRANVSPTSDIEMLAEDQPVSAGATPAASVSTGARHLWLMATVVFASGAQSAPSPPSGVGASPGNSSVNVSWTAPPSGGSPITSYTVTPYIGSAAQPTTVVTGTPPATTAVSGLSNGTTYTFTVTATNSIGTSPPSAASSLTTPSPEPQGEWSALQTFPMVAISSILMDNGSFIFWDGWQQPEPTEVWNPAIADNLHDHQRTRQRVLRRCRAAPGRPDYRCWWLRRAVNRPDRNSRHQHLRSVDQHLDQGGQHELPRWYPTLTELSDGRYVAISGNSTDSNHWADTPEVYDPTTNTWTLLSGISTSQIHEEEYPFSYLIPNGNVLTIGPSEDVTYEMNVDNQTWTPVGGQSGVVNGSSIQYLPGKILYSGGASSVINTELAQATTAVLDTNCR